jgi:ribosomal protein S18 acetylase RimI-like enzyme
MIRPATEDDLPALAAMMAASPLLARYRTRFDGALTALRSALADGDVVLCAGEPALGFVWLSLAPRLLNGAAYLRLLLVAAPSHGVGTDLLEEAEAVGRERGLRHMYLLCTTDNTGARRFYERHGYRHVGDLPGLVWPDLDEALYEKRL